MTQLGRGAAIAWLVGGAISAHPAPDDVPGRSLPCTTAQEGFGFARVICHVDPSRATDRLRVTATFAGVHDDSSAALAVAGAGDQPIACAAGGQPRIEGEENGDTLVCAFALPAAGSARDVTINIVWHHAEPASFALRRE